MNNPWEHPELSKIWKTKSSFMSFVRGCLRRAWNTHPSKLLTIKEKRKMIPNPKPKGKKEVWGFDCELCGETFVQKEGQVDHKVPAGALQDISDIQGFTERLICVTPDDLRLICKGCNSILAYADKNNISFELAKATKQAITIQKEKKDVEFLNTRGIVPESNATKRRQQLIELLVEESGNEIMCINK